MVGLYGLAALLCVGIAPFTVGVMKGTNDRLIELSEGAEQKVEEGEVRGLLEKWGRLNGVRSLLPVLGGVAGVVAVLA